MNNQLHSPDWIQNARKREHDQWLLILLDAIEPIAPIVAQGLWVCQPLVGLWGGAQSVQGLAQLLEDPEGIPQLRQQLSNDTRE